MSMVVAEIEAQIRSLGQQDKAELLRALISDLDGPAEPGVDVAWLEEARRRHRDARERGG
jgi:hypothetical protein